MNKLILILIASFLVGCVNENSTQRYDYNSREARDRALAYDIKLIIRYYKSKYDFVVYHYRDVYESDHEKILSDMEKYAVVVSNMLSSRLISEREAKELLMEYVENNISLSDFDFVEAGKRYQVRSELMGEKLMNDLEIKFKNLTNNISYMISAGLIEPFQAFEKINEVKRFQYKIIYSGGDGFKPLL